MRKTMLTLVVTLLLSVTCLVSNQVYAGTLDDVISNSSDNSLSSSDSSNDGTSDLEKSIGDNGTIYQNGILNSDMSETSQEAVKLSSPIYKVAKIVTQLMVIIMFSLIPLSLLVDIGYVFIPLGRTGGPQTGMQQGQQGMGGYGSGYSSGYSSGYGGGYDSSYDSGYGAGAGMGGQAGGPPSELDAKTKFLIFPVSKEALRIGAMEAPFTTKAKELAKDTILKGILTVVFIILVVTGTLQKIGGAAGVAAANGLYSAISMF